MKICIFGAGAIGGHLAGRLASTGAELSIIARGANLAAIQRNGLTVQTPSETLRARPFATDDPAKIGPQDAVIITAKAPALPAIAAAIAPLLGPESHVTFVMNGIPWWYFHGHGGKRDGHALDILDPGQTIRRAIDPARAIGAVIYSACTVITPGTIQVDHAVSRLVLGEPDGRLTERVARLASLLNSDGLRTETSPSIRNWIWNKLLMNLATGPFSVLTQSAPKDAFAEPALRDAARAIYAEAGAIAAALGVTTGVDVARQMHLSQSMTHKPSILQDLESARPMEIDAIYAAPLALARLTGTATPTLDLLVALATIRARAAGLHPPGIAANAMRHASASS